MKEEISAGIILFNELDEKFLIVKLSIQDIGIL